MLVRLRIIFTSDDEPEDEEDEEAEREEVEHVVPVAARQESSDLREENMGGGILIWLLFRLH